MVHVTEENGYQTTNEPLQQLIHAVDSGPGIPVLFAFVNSVNESVDLTPMMLRLAQRVVLTLQVVNLFDDEHDVETIVVAVQSFEGATM